ncbi:putative protein phosphatase 2C 55 [Rosa sericea]
MNWLSKIPRVAEIIWVQLESDPTPLKEGTILKMVCGSFYLPKESENRSLLGEDAHFICAEENTIGVADGVGGWAKYGVDAGEYARKLMDNSVMAVHNQHRKSGDVDVDPIQILHEAYGNTKNIAGTSTACIVTLSDEGRTLHAVNVGDSGFMVFRDKKCVYISPIRQVYFNCPLQLGTGSGNTPQSATEIKVKVLRPGDVIVLGTDGLLDNVSPGEIEKVLEENTIEGFVEPEMLAWIIAERLALRNSEDAGRLTPFSIAAHKAGVEHIGGKRDDITVIVGQILAA